MLTKEQEEQFKKLYLEDYSASLIFMTLEDSPFNPQRLYNQQMRAYRIKLGLPLRGSAHVPKYRRRPPIQIIAKISKVRKRIENLKKRIADSEHLIIVWKKELATLESFYRS